MPPVSAKPNSSAVDLHKVKNNAITKAKTAKSSTVNIPDIIVKDPNLKRYWYKRKKLFSLYDMGIEIPDAESWYSVTPESVARETAERMACDVLIDGFCGCGGNTIQFAMTCKKVIAIDIDPIKVNAARHNAAIYGVADRIEFIVGDFLQLCKTGQLQGNAVFLSPPWGGPTYNYLSEYDIEEKLQPVGATELIALARKITNKIGLFLPRNSITKQIFQLAGAGNSCEIEHNYLGGRAVGLTAFYGVAFNKKWDNLYNQACDGIHFSFSINFH